MQMLNRIGWNLWRLRRSVGLILLLVLSWILFYVTRMSFVSFLTPSANIPQHYIAFTDDPRGLAAAASSL